MADLLCHRSFFSCKDNYADFVNQQQQQSKEIVRGPFSTRINRAVVDSAHPVVEWFTSQITSSAEVVSSVLSMESVLLI